MKTLRDKYSSPPESQVVDADAVPDGLLTPEGKRIFDEAHAKRLRPGDWMKEVIRLARDITGDANTRETAKLVMEVVVANRKVRQELHSQQDAIFEEIQRFLDTKYLGVDE